MCMMNSREEILRKLRAAPRPFPNIAQPSDYLPMTPMPISDQVALKDRFIREAENLSCFVHEPPSSDAAARVILNIIGDDKQVVSWDMDQIPYRLLGSVLAESGITVGVPGDPAVRVGFTGADAALAATGSVVLASGSGNYRAPSLLTTVHVAIITPDQILPNMESWLALKREAELETFRRSSNVVIISGASRTADIAMELILGMHGPRELHIIILTT